MMSSDEHATKHTVEYHGISIQCSNANSVQLLQAILFRDVGQLKHVISVEGGADVNELCRCWTNCQPPTACVRYALTPLSVAVRFSTNRVIRLLLKHGANPNVMCDMTPLGVAVQKNDMRLVALLLDTGADINLLTHPVVKWKSSGCGGGETARFPPMQTPLHIACRKGFATMATYLLQKQAATDVIDGGGNAPADVARNYGHRNIEVQILEQVLKVSTADACKSSKTVCPVPCDDGNMSLATHYKRTYTTDLIMACTNNDVKKSRSLICDAANVNAVDASLNTALHYACAVGNEKLVKLLLGNGAKADAVNALRESSIEVAVKHGYFEIALILIGHKCMFPHDVLFATDSDGNTLLHIACKRSRIPAVKQLLMRGADLNVVNEKGKSPMHYAWQSANTELRRIVMDHVFEYYQAECFNKFVELRSYTMLCEVVSVNDEDIHTNLCSTCRKLTPDACYFMIRRGMCDIGLSLASCCSSPCKANLTSLLHIACRTWQKDTVKRLVDSGADVNAVDCRGNTPLHLACCRGSESYDLCQSVIAMLLDKGARPNVVNYDAKTPLWCAFSKNDSKLVHWLILEKDFGVDSDVMCGCNIEGNTLVLMLAIDETDEFLWKLVDSGARINVPPRTAFDRVHSASNPFRRQPSLLDVLAKNNSWSLVRKLIEVGCCDFTQEIFRCLFQPLFDKQLVFRRMRMCKWFLLTGFGQRDEFNTHIERFLLECHLQEFHSEWERKCDCKENGDDEDDVIDHPCWAASSNADTKKTLRWLKHDIENPASLSRLCVYTIRRQLIVAEPDGKSIFPGIDKLPLPTRLKDSLKLLDLEWDDGGFIGLTLPCHFGMFEPVSLPGYQLRRKIRMTRTLKPVIFELFLSQVESLPCEDKLLRRAQRTQNSVQRCPRKSQLPKGKLKSVGRPAATSHFIRRTRTLFQPSRRH